MYLTDFATVSAVDEDEMLLDRVSKKVDIALQMTERARADCRFEAGLWYHAIGLMNAFYAILEEMKKNVGNNRHPVASPMVVKWVKENDEKIRDLVVTARNSSTHQGEIETEAGLNWEIDVWNDTEHPTPIALVSVKRSNIQKLNGDDFLNKMREAFNFIKDGLDTIEAEYKATGGTDNLRTDPRGKFTAENLF